MASAASKRLQKEYTDIVKTPPTWAQANLVGDNLQKWKATIQGPEGTPYEKGTFLIDIDFPNEYPFKPPTIKFTTKIYHPNISKEGLICAEVFSNWSPQLKAIDVLNTIRSILIEPNPDNSLEPEIAEIYRSDRNAFNKSAKENTKKYAK